MILWKHYYWKFLPLFVCFAYSVKTDDVDGPESKSDLCVRNITAIILDNWQCKTPCSVSRPCENTNTKCMCAGPCGEVCVPTDLICTKPEAPDFGSVSVKNEYLYGMKVRYSCSTGYKLVGGAERFCREDEKWSGLEPFCAKEGPRCRPPTFEFANATADFDVERKEFYLDEEIAYACDEGFEAENIESYYTTCVATESGEADWMNITLNCLPFGQKECEKDETAIKKENRMCRSSCADSRSCRNLKSRCLCDYPCGMTCIPTELKCKKPTLISHGKVDAVEGNVFGNKMNYSCDEGFELIGPQERFCQGDQKWSGSEPFCTKKGVRCPVPHLDIASASVVYDPDKTEFYLGDVITSLCHKGYEPEIIQDSYNMRCIETETGGATWTNITLNCLPVTCGSPEDIENGYVEGGNFTFNSEVSYSCYLGYALLGSTVRQCQEDGTWSGNTPNCTLVDCGEPVSPRNGSIIFRSGSTYKKQVDYSCDDNTIPSGSTFSTCEINGIWTPPAPLCLSYCLTEDFLNGYLVPKSVTHYFKYNMIPTGIFLPHNASAVIVCDDGFEVPNNESSTKQISDVVCKDGSWQPTTICQPARCFCDTLDFSELQKRNFLLSQKCQKSIDSGMELTLKCDPQYPERVKKGNLPCEQGKWLYPTDLDVRCDLQPCSVMNMRIRHGEILKNDVLWNFDPAVSGPAEVPHNTILRFRCTKPGYQIFIGGKPATSSQYKDNSAVRKCENGIWTGQMPVCKKVTPYSLARWQ